MSTFEARADSHEWASLAGWGVRLAAVLTAAFFVLLAVTGVIDVDPREDWFMLGWGALALVAMVWYLPRSFQADVALRTRGPLLQLQSDALVYGGSRFPDHALLGALRGELGTQEEHSRWVSGDVIYVYFDPAQLGYRRRDSLIDTRTRRITIETRHFADPVGMARALIEHLQRREIPYEDCGTSRDALRAAEDRLTSRRT